MNRTNGSLPGTPPQSPRGRPLDRSEAISIERGASPAGSNSSSLEMVGPSSTPRARAGETRRLLGLPKGDSPPGPSSPIAKFIEPAKPEEVRIQMPATATATAHSAQARQPQAVPPSPTHHVPLIPYSRQAYIPAPTFRSTFAQPKMASLAVAAVGVFIAAGGTSIAFLAQAGTSVWLPVLLSGLGMVVLGAIGFFLSKK